MSDIFHAPLNTITEADSNEAATFGDVMPRLLPSGDNYADDKMVRAQINDELTALIDQTRKDRAALTDEWMSIRRMENLIHDDGQKYKGRSTAYLPVFARLLNTQVATLVKGIFPSDDYLDCVDRLTHDPERAKASKQYVQWEFERNAKLRRNMKVFARQLKSYGNSPLKFLYRKEKRYEGRQFKQLLATGGYERRDAFAKISYEGLEISTRSLFNFHVYPLTADNLEEASLVFEDMEVLAGYIETKGKEKDAFGRPVWKNIYEALNGPPVEEVDNNRFDLHGDAFGLQDSNVNRGPLSKRVTLTEAWTFLKLPKSAYVAGEHPDCPVPVMVTLAGQIPVCVIRNPYFHQRPPYLFGRTNATPGLIYGYGVGKLSRSLQYLTNDFANQTNDGGNYALNPIGLRNPSHVAGPMGPLQPGRVWDFTDIDKGFRFDRPPLEIIGAGMNMVSMFMTMAQDLGGAPPQLSGSTSGGAKTATGMQILQRNAMSPLQDEVEDLEQDILMPLMYGTWYNGQQFRDKRILSQLAGAPIDIDPQSLAIDAEFRWLASSQAVNAQQRAQQLIQFMQVLAPMVPLLMQQGYMVDFAPLIQRALGDGMGIRGIQDIIKRVPLGLPTGPLPPESMGGAMQAQGDRVRSALEQAGGAPGEAVPGEGEAFMETRNEADQMAALMGAMQGQ